MISLKILSHGQQRQKEESNQHLNLEVIAHLKHSFSLLNGFSLHPFFYCFHYFIHRLVHHHASFDLAHRHHFNYLGQTLSLINQVTFVNLNPCLNLNSSTIAFYYKFSIFNIMHIII